MPCECVPHAVGFKQQLDSAVVRSGLMGNSREIWVTVRRYTGAAVGSKARLASILARLFALQL